MFWLMRGLVFYKNRGKSQRDKEIIEEVLINSLKLFCSLRIFVFSRDSEALESVFLGDVSPAWLNFLHLVTVSMIYKCCSKNGLHHHCRISTEFKIQPNEKQKSHFKTNVCSFYIFALKNNIKCL